MLMRKRHGLKEILSIDLSKVYECKNIYTWIAAKIKGPTEPQSFDTLKKEAGKRGADRRGKHVFGAIR